MVLLALVFLIFGAMSKCTAASSSGFEVSGQMETISVGGTNRRSFLVQTDGKDVFIQCGAGMLDQGVKGTEFGTDGTNGYYLSRFLLRAEPGRASGLVNDSTLRVDSSPVPPRNVSAVAHIWLVYAAYQQWGNRRTEYLPARRFFSPNEVGGDSDRWRMVNDHLLLRAEWDIESQRPGMLKRFVEFRDGKWDTDRYSPGLIPASLRTGGTNLVMQVLSWTNTEMGRLPVETVIASYRSNPNDLNGGLHLNATTRLKATHFDVLRTRRNFIPELTKATSVIDYRFAQGPERPASYLSTNGVIRSTFEEAWAESMR